MCVQSRPLPAPSLSAQSLQGVEWGVPRCSASSQLHQKALRKAPSWVRHRALPHSPTPTPPLARGPRGTRVRMETLSPTWPLGPDLARARGWRGGFGAGAAHLSG